MSAQNPGRESLGNSDQQSVKGNERAREEVSIAKRPIVSEKDGAASSEWLDGIEDIMERRDGVLSELAK